LIDDGGGKWVCVIPEIAPQPEYGQRKDVRINAGA
jgi:hypothetical protein